MFEPGTYRGQLKDAVTTEAKTGTLQMAITFNVTERWNGTGWHGVDAPADRKVFIALTDKAMPYSQPKLEKLGFNGDFEHPAFETEPSGVELTCKADTYEGKPRENWELGNWGGELEQAATDKLKRLNARWRATAMSQNTSAQISAQTTAPAPTLPPPPTPPPPPGTPVRASTRDAAWARLVEMWGEKKSEAELHERWHEAIADRRKPEDQFTPEDWGAVEVSFDVPF